MKCFLLLKYYSCFVCITLQKSKGDERLALSFTALDQWVRFPRPIFQIQARGSDKEVLV